MANLYQRTALAIAVSACFPATALANAARVDFAVGNVTATGADGRSRTLTRGAEISQGDTVSTQNGRAQLRFADGAYMSLQPQTEFKIEEFNFAGKEDGKEGIVMNLIKGGMRTITGLIGRSNRHSYKLKTEVATIGIRGTEYSVQYTNSIEVFCAGGSINLENQGGSLTISGGQGAQVQTQNTAPQQTSQPPVLSPTSSSQQQQEEQQASDEPTNPTQEADPPVTEEKALAQISTPPAAPPLLTGTMTGPWAASCQTCGEVQAWTGAQFGPVSWTLDSAGKATAFSNAPEGPVGIGAATAMLDGNDGIIAWGRWVDGVTSGTNTVYGSRTLTSSAPLHWVAGLPATNLPTTGTATYTMLGQTPASMTGSITSASVTSSTINVNFASSAASLNMSLLVNGTNYSTGTMGITRHNDWASGGGTVSATGTMLRGSGNLNSCSGSLEVSGFLSGDGAGRAGLVYNASIFIGASGNVKGAVVYKKN